MIIYYWILFLISVLVSQSAMDFFSILFCGQWGWMVWNSKKQGKSRKLFSPFGLETIFIAWVLVVTIGFLFNLKDPSYALVRITEFKWILILYVLVEILKLYQPDQRNYRFALWFMLFFSGANLFLFFADFPILNDLRYGSTEGGFLRAGGFFANPMTFAHSFVLFVSFYLGVLFFQFPKLNLKERLFSVLTVALSVTGLFLTYTRGVWVGFTAGLVGVLFFWRPKIAIGLSVALIAVGVSLFQLSPAFQWRVTRTVEEIQGASERKTLWSAHGLIFKENPVFGLGYGQNTRELRTYYDRLGVPQGTIESHAHNQYLHLAAGTGLLGLLCYFLIWAFFYLILFRLWKLESLSTWDRGIVFGGLLAQTAFLIGGLTEANFEHSKVRFALMIVWSFIIYLGFKYNQLPNWNWFMLIKGRK